MSEKLYEEAGMRIRNLREQKGYSREQLSEMSDISTKFLYEIESGKKGFSVHTLARIADSLDVNCDYIISGNETNLVYHSITGIVSIVGIDKIKFIEDILHIVYEMVKE